MAAAGSGLTKEEYHEFLRTIEDRRIELGMIQQEAIERTHVILKKPKKSAHQNTWSRIVNGVTLTSLGRIRAMAEVVGLEVVVKIRKVK